MVDNNFQPIGQNSEMINGFNNGQVMNNNFNMPSADAGQTGVIPTGWNVAMGPDKLYNRAIARLKGCTPKLKENRLVKTLITLNDRGCSMPLRTFKEIVREALCMRAGLLEIMHDLQTLNDGGERYEAFLTEACREVAKIILHNTYNQQGLQNFCTMD